MLGVAQKKTGIIDEVRRLHDGGEDHRHDGSSDQQPNGWCWLRMIRHGGLGDCRHSILLAWRQVKKTTCNMQNSKRTTICLRALSAHLIVQNACPITLVIPLPRQG
jgi:hypothetical protein